MPPTGRVLDIGCGTGAHLQELARKFPRLTLVGVDPVPEMLVVAHGRTPPNTELRQAWAEELPFVDDCLGVAVSRSVFHYVRQPVFALKEMSRVLRPGSELLITNWCDDYLACRVCHWWLRRASRAHVKVYRVRECHRWFKEAGLPGAH